MALLFAAGYTPAEAQRLYMYHCPKIFTTSPARRYSPFVARYQNTHLLSMMQAYFGDLKINELPKSVMVTSFKIRSDPNSQEKTFYKQSGKGWRPALFSNVPRLSGQVNPDDTLCSDVACRTSAAPTFFPTYQNYVDGAIFANNPALSAIAKVRWTKKKTNKKQETKTRVLPSSFSHRLPVITNMFTHLGIESLFCLLVLVITTILFPSPSLPWTGVCANGHLI